jgi:hypothetical protein
MIYTLVLLTVPTPQITHQKVMNCWIFAAFAEDPVGLKAE